MALLRWLPPPEGWVKLNADGAVRRVDHRSACGGIVRDFWGNLVMGFAEFLGDCSVIEAELRGILRGLKIVARNQNDRVIIESDSQSAIQMITDGVPETHPCSRLVRKIKALSKHFSVVRWQHVLRESNKVVDCLAKEGIGDE